MKVFISWSGELSQKVAAILYEWLPQVIQSVKPFYSTKDISKGENWDNRLTNELANCNYGILCLTPDNVQSPWLHYEAGALSKELDSRVSALMINTATSNVQGPLSRVQNTKFDEEDIFELLKSINECSGESKIKEETLEKVFKAMWTQCNDDIRAAIDGYSPDESQEEVEQDLHPAGDAIEEILRLMRSLDTRMSRLEKDNKYILSDNKSGAPEFRSITIPAHLRDSFNIAGVFTEYHSYIHHIAIALMNSLNPYKTNEITISEDVIIAAIDDGKPIDVSGRDFIRANIKIISEELRKLLQNQTEDQWYTQRVVRDDSIIQLCRAPINNLRE